MNEPRGPDKCPITGLPFFMNIEHPELGMIATYGGPFDSYTIPAADDDDEGWVYDVQELNDSAKAELFRALELP